MYYLSYSVQCGIKTLLTKPSPKSTEQKPSCSEYNTALFSVASALPKLTNSMSMDPSKREEICLKVKPKDLKLIHQVKHEGKEIMNSLVLAKKSCTLVSANQVLVNAGSSHNPIYLDSDEDSSHSIVLLTRVAVDQIRIGRFRCGRTRFNCPSLRCFDNHFTIYVWEKKRDDDDEKEMKISFQIEILYSDLTYASFSRKDELCFCVFAMSCKPKEIPVALHRKDSKLLGKFYHDSKNIRESSIIVTSTQRKPIQRLRKLFLKYCPDVMSVLLNKELRKFKPKAYLKSHGIRQKSSIRKPFPDGHVTSGTSEILVYPKQESAHGAVTLTMNDVSRLQPGVYLNDNLLDFYLQYLY